MGKRKTNFTLRSRRRKREQKWFRDIYNNPLRYYLLQRLANGPRTILTTDTRGRRPTANHYVMNVLNKVPLVMYPKGYVIPKGGKRSSPSKRKRSSRKSFTLPEIEPRELNIVVPNPLPENKVSKHDYSLRSRDNQNGRDS